MKKRKLGVLIIVFGLLSLPVSAAERAWEDSITLDGTNTTHVSVTGCEIGSVEEDPDDSAGGTRVVKDVTCTMPKSGQMQIHIYRDKENPGFFGVCQATFYDDDENWEGMENLSGQNYGEKPSFNGPFNQKHITADNNEEGGIRCKQKSDDEYYFTIGTEDWGNITHFSVFVELAPGAYRFHVDLVDGPAGEGKVQHETTKAKRESGEDEGKLIDEDIVDPVIEDTSDVSTAGKIAISLGAALVAGATVLGGKNAKKKKRYKMYVYKRFGDTIRKGAGPVQVFARITEITDKGEINRPDLSKKITVAGNGLTAQPAGIVNEYMGAYVSASKTDGDTGTLTFSFAGPGGFFYRNIEFRLVGDPRIVFPRMTEDGTGWIVNADLDTVYMVAGTGGNASLRFMFLDAAEEPKEITFADTDGFEVGYIKDTTYAFTYHAQITNKTDRIPKEKDIFADPIDRDIMINATFPDGTTVSSPFRVKLWPDGLSVPAKNAKDGALYIDTTLDENAGEGFAKIAPAGFEIYVCYTDANGSAVILENPGVTFGKIDDDGKYDNLFEYNFSYHMGRAGSSGFWLFPEETLPMLKEPYDAVLPITCEEGPGFDAVLPLAFNGEKPVRPSTAEWNAAFERLKKAVNKFGIGNDPQLRALIRDANNHSAADLEFIRYCVIETGVEYYRLERKEFENWDNYFTNRIIVAGAFVKVGDYTLEMLLKKQFGGYGGLAAKFINPLKNLMATYVGEYIANGNIDRAPDFLKTVLEGCKEALSSAMTGAFFGEESFQDPTNAVLQAGSKFLMVTGKAAEEIKDKLGYVIAVYLLTCYVGHYTYGEHGEKGDVYLSGVETVKDLLLDSVKAWFLGFVSDYCKSLFEKIGRVCGNIYKGLCQKQIREMSDLAGERAFGDGIRAGFREGFGTLSKESLEAARDASRSAIKESREIQDEIVKNTTDLLLSKGKELGEFVSKNVLDSAVLGEILRYKLAENETEREAFGTEDLKGAVYNYLTKLLGVKINKFFATVAEDYYAVKNLDLSEVTAGIEGGQIVLCVLGFRAEIDIAENIEALSASLFDYLFSWMNDLWKSAKSFAGYGSDPRDQVEEDPVKIKEDIEIRKNRLVHMEWRYEDYINSVTNKET